jgi:PII-like signaling protein
MKVQFEAQMLRIYFGESDRWMGKPLHEAIVAKCQELGLTNAMVYRGIEGYGSSTRIHRPSPWKLSRDAPMMVSVIETEEQIARLLPHLDAMVGEGLIVKSKVEAIRYTRAGGMEKDA